MDGYWPDFAVLHIQVMAHNMSNLMFRCINLHGVLQTLPNRLSGVNKDIEFIHFDNCVLDDFLISDSLVSKFYLCI